jgi:hypothetical protein
MAASQMHQTIYRGAVYAPKEANETVTACNALNLSEAVARKRVKKEEF